MAKVDTLLKKKFIALGLGIFAAAVLTLGAIQLSLFAKLESVTWDARLKYIAPHTSPDTRIRIITIDQSSIDHFAREERIFWPWPRSLYTPVLKFLELGGASVAALNQSCMLVGSPRASAESPYIMEGNGAVDILCVH